MNSLNFSDVQSVSKSPAAVENFGTLGEKNLSILPSFEIFNILSKRADTEKFWSSFEQRESKIVTHEERIVIVDCVTTHLVDTIWYYASNEIKQQMAQDLVAAFPMLGTLTHSDDGKP